MRWHDLFDDLEHQLAAELDADEAQVRAEEERLRIGRTSLRDRIATLAVQVDGAPVHVEFRDGGVLRLVPTAFGRDWFGADVLVEGSRRGAVVVPLVAVAGLWIAPRDVGGSIPDPERGEAASALSSRLGLPFVLRDLARRRTPVSVRTVAGEVFGTIDRVGRDHLDLAEHERGVARRAAAVARVRVVPFDRIELVRL